MKKLSIIIPFHQYENYLKECLCALKDSSFHDFETILVLDEADDVSHLIKIFKEDLSLKVVTLEAGHGVAASRNLGLKHATGEYVYFLDSDDYVLVDTLENLVRHLNGEDIVYGVISNTWNNKANYLEKKAKKMDDIDEDDQEERDLQREMKRLGTLEKYAQSHETYGSYERLCAYYYCAHKKKGLNDLSVLGKAYRKEFLEKRNLTFDESFKFYSDLPFIMTVLEKAESFHEAREAIYVKRKHNDPINYPALVQESDENRFNERMRVFTYTRTLIDSNGLLRQILDRKIINYFLFRFIKRLRRSENPQWKKEYYPMFSEVLKDSHPEVVSKMKPKNRRLLASIQKNDLKKTLSLIRWKLGWIKFKQLLKNKNVFYKLAYYHVFLKQPLKENVVMFETFNGKNYSDSPKYIYEYLASHYPNDFECVWSLNTDSKLKYGGKKIKRFSFQYAYYLARAKYLVFNVRPPLWYRKREGQVFLETWHGTPLKRLVFDQEEVTAASPKYKQEFYKQRKDWDYLISANDFSTETLRRCFMYEGEMLDYGYPRNDLMYAPNKEEIAATIKKKLNIPTNKKTILYAPTWRDDEYYGKGKYKFTLKLDLPLLKEQLGDEYVILLRTHQYIADALDVTGLEGFAYNVSKYDDITELYLISDICITDYSSVFFDYANLKRPMLFYTYDIEKYRNQLRGFYIDMETEVPGPLLYTSEEVIDAIKNIDQVIEQYKTRYETFYQRFCHLDDGNASKRVVEKVFFGGK